MGEPDHGHPRLAGPRHRDAHLGPSAAEALRPDETPHIPDHDEKHLRARRLPTHHHLFPTLCR